jgi:hypothetical protein
MNLGHHSPTPIPARSSPAATPPRSSATSPRTAPSRPPLAKLSLPLGSLAPPRAKAPNRCPRTGSPAANRHRAHRRPGPPPRTAGSSRRQPLTPFSPPSALSGMWAPRRRRRPRAPAPSPALGRSWAGALARCAWLGQFPPHGPPEA